MFIKSKKKNCSTVHATIVSRVRRCRKRRMVYSSCEEKNSSHCREAFSCYFINSPKQDNVGFSVVLFYIHTHTYIYIYIFFFFFAFEVADKVMYG